MNKYRLMKLKENGKDSAVVILLSENAPARKSQKKVRFKCNKIIVYNKIFRYKSIRVKQLKVNL